MLRAFSAWLVGALALSATWAAAGDEGDPRRGAQAFRQCAACHSLEPGRHLTGPSLAGVVGRPADAVLRRMSTGADADGRVGIDWNVYGVPDIFENRPETSAMIAWPLDLPLTGSLRMVDENMDRARPDDRGDGAMNEPNSKLATSPETTLGQDVLALVSHWLRGRRGWVLLGLVAVAGGLWIGWPSLVAAGVAPLLLGVLPCVAMCALGLCMKGGGQSCDAKQATTSRADTTAEAARPNLSDERQETDR